MKKIYILLFIISFTLYFSGCSFNNSQTVNEPALTPEAIDKSLVENKYYEKNRKRQSKNCRFIWKEYYNIRICSLN